MLSKRFTCESFSKVFVLSNYFKTYLQIHEFQNKLKQLSQSVQRFVEKSLWKLLWKCPELLDQSFVGILHLIFNCFNKLLNISPRQDVMWTFFDRRIINVKILSFWVTYGMTYSKGVSQSVIQEPTCGYKKHQNN